jgi:gas vesicle protein
VASGVRDAPHAVARQAEGNPLAAGLIAFGVGLLAASLLPASRQEQRAAQAVKEQAVPQVKEAAAQVADQLREPAREAVETVKERATEAAGTVKEHGAGAAQDLRDQAQQSAQEVKEAPQQG